tara:strand:- start:612 stop:770 length:159 start_codon:yes stop_codon:yes gene_type:complete
LTLVHIFCGYGFPGKHDEDTTKDFGHGVTMNLMEKTTKIYSLYLVNTKTIKS